MTAAEHPHPETYCHRCGGPNLWSWAAPSPLWNAVMREPDDSHEIGIVCPQCFVAMAEERGVIRPGHSTWRIYPDGGLMRELPTTDPDGRVWDSDEWLWADPEPPA